MLREIDSIWSAESTRTTKILCCERHFVAPEVQFFFDQLSSRWSECGMPMEALADNITL
jgi:hypothetical protein